MSARHGEGEDDVEPGAGRPVAQVDGRCPYARRGGGERVLRKRAAELAGLADEAAVRDQQLVLQSTALRDRHVDAQLEAHLLDLDRRRGLDADDAAERIGDRERHRLDADLRGIRVHVGRGILEQGVLAGVDDPGSEKRHRLRDANRKLEPIVAPHGTSMMTSIDQSQRRTSEPSNVGGPRPGTSQVQSHATSWPAANDDGPASAASSANDLVVAGARHCRVVLPLLSVARYW